MSFSPFGRWCLNFRDCGGDYLTEIIVAIVSGGLALVGVIITTKSSNRKIEQKLQISQVRTETKLENLTDEVRRHNNFAVRTPVLEQEIIDIKKELATLKAYHMKDKKEE